MKRQRSKITAALGILCALTAVFAAGSQASRASGPVTLWVLTDVTVPPGNQSIVETFQATATAINVLDRGINGRPLALHVCDTASNPNTTASCAQQAVAAHAAAVVSYVKNPGVYQSILEQAGIPNIGNAMITTQEQTSPDSFPILPGGVGAVAGAAVIGKQQKCKDMVWITAAPATFAAAYAVATAAWRDKLDAFGIKHEDLIFAPPGAPDFSSYIQAANATGADCLMLNGAGSDLVGMLPAAKAGWKGSGPIIMFRQNFDRAAAKAMGTNLNGVILEDSAWPETDPENYAGVKRYVSDMTSYHPGGMLSISGSDASAWTAVRLFAYAARRVKHITSQTMTNFLNHLKNYDPGVAPPISFTGPAPGAVAARQFEPVAMVEKWSNGKPVGVGFFNLGTAAQAKFVGGLTK
jgi:ABC-type branched-subunit amino acid transport system substrate-binding protein